MWPFTRRGLRRRSANPWDLANPLMNLTRYDSWSIGDACQGAQVFGSTGSGKSSGAVAAITRAFMSAGFGGLLLTTKPSDRADYERYARETGRTHDLRVFGIDEPLRFNPIDAELHRQDAGAGLTENIVALLGSLLEVSERSSGQGGQEDSGFWKRTNRQLTRNAVDLLAMATGSLSVPDLYRLVVSAPTSLEQLRSDDWKRQSFCFRCLVQAEKQTMSPQKQADFELVADFFMVEFVHLSERTRSVVVSTFTSMLDILNRGAVRELMSTTTNVTPEMAQEGALILVDLPIKVFGEVGAFCQVLWKQCFQLAMERRNIATNGRPTFILCDESHLLTTSNDQTFQTTARSSRTATLYSTQSLSNYLAVFGSQAEADVYSLLGNLQTQIFHQQADTRTNQYASELIGRTRQYLVNCNNSYQAPGLFDAFPQQQGAQLSTGISETIEYEVQPSRFASLRKGGPPHFQVDGIIYQGGRQFSGTGAPWMPVTFNQSF